MSFRHVVSSPSEPGVFLVGRSQAYCWKRAPLKTSSGERTSLRIPGRFATRPLPLHFALRKADFGKDEIGP